MMSSGTRLKILYDAMDFEEAGEIDRAIQLYKAAARDGSSAAMLNLGNIFSEKGRFLDINKAKYWYKKSIQRGESAGALNMAVLYRSLGKRRWHLFWLDRAVALGNDDAIDDFTRLNA